LKYRLCRARITDCLPKNTDDNTRRIFGRLINRPSLINCDPPSIRHTSSETGLFGRVQSIDDFQKTLIADVGPNGNDLLSTDATAKINDDNGNDLLSNDASANINDDNGHGEKQTQHSTQQAPS
jgi:hypothetical protein